MKIYFSTVFPNVILTDNHLSKNKLLGEYYTEDLGVRLVHSLNNMRTLLYEIEKR